MKQSSYSRANCYLFSKIPMLFLEHEIYLSVYENPPRPTGCLLNLVTQWYYMLKR